MYPKADHHSRNQHIYTRFIYTTVYNIYFDSFFSLFHLFTVDAQITPTLQFTV